jgi:hypothetical protein
MKTLAILRALTSSHAHDPSVTRAFSMVCTGALLSLVMLSGCNRQAPQDHPRVFVYIDHTASITRLQPELIRLATQIAMSAPPKTVIEASTFGSVVKIAPFYTGTIRKPAAFQKATQDALAKPAQGRGTFGAPLLKRVRELIHGHSQPVTLVFLSDCGFDDLDAMRAEAALLAKEPSLVALYALPAVSDSSAYTNLQATLRPLGERVRIAALADAPEAIQELRSILRKK